MKRTQKARETEGFAWQKDDIKPVKHNENNGKQDYQNGNHGIQAGSVLTLVGNVNNGNLWMHQNTETICTILGISFWAHDV